MALFNVNYTFHATAGESIEADNLEDAKRIVAERIEADDFDLDPERIDDVDFYIQELRPVTREGQRIWTTHVRSTDTLGHGEGQS